MRVPQDYHVHSRFSVDCQVPMAALCERAIALGIPEICITDHADFVPEDKGYGYFRPDAYFADIERCRALYGDRLTIRAGVEIGEAHRYPYESDLLMDEYPFDFVIGSLHWVENALIFSDRYFESKTLAEAYGAYFQELLVMVRVGGFDVLGHLDAVKRYGFEVYGPFDPRQFEEPLREVLRACVEVGIGLEINTGPLRRPVREPSPTLDVLRWYRELGGEILTIGSDAHQAEHVGYGLEVAVELAKAAGFTQIATFRERQPHFVPLL